MLQILLAIGGGRVTKGWIDRGALGAIMRAIILLAPAAGYQIGLNGRSRRRQAGIKVGW